MQSFYHLTAAHIASKKAHPPASAGEWLHHYIGPVNLAPTVI
jgi:hypothetical protein